MYALGCEIFKLRVRGKVVRCDKEKQFLGKESIWLARAAVWGFSVH